MASQAQMPIAIVGISCRLPGGTKDPESLWSMLAEGRSGHSEVPQDRFNFNSFYHPDLDTNGALNHRGGHFLQEDISKFDAGFFGIPPNEANSMDPQQRITLESAYEALENAGIPLKEVQGSKTSVYWAIFTRDYMSMMFKDTSDLAKYHVTGVGDAILANRLSYIFDLKGPSVTLDTGCSGSLVAIHLACQSLRSGESDQAIAGGVNLILSPDTMIPMSLLHILNDDGKCYTFDDRGAGYGRGEGVATVILKRLDDALAAGDNIRAVIRGTGVNQDGKTNGIAMPNQFAQQDLSRSIYDSIGLDPSKIGYVEAHGTGTEAGDNAETKSIANVFCGSKRTSPLFVGSIKSNIGHLESASGISGLLKAIMAVEKGQIPPNLNLKEFKKGLTLEEDGIKIPMKLEQWPTTGEIRRASVASFGYGGTNSHIVIEEPPVNRRISNGTNRVHTNGHTTSTGINGRNNYTNGHTNGHANGYTNGANGVHINKQNEQQTNKYINGTIEVFTNGKNGCKIRDTNGANGMPIDEHIESHIVENATVTHEVHTNGDTNGDINGSTNRLAKDTNRSTNGESALLQKNGHINGHTNGYTAGTNEHNNKDSTLVNEDRGAYLLAVTAKSEYSLQKNIDNLKNWVCARGESEFYLKNLEYTLAARRTHMQWRSTVTVTSHVDLIDSFERKAWKPNRAATDIRTVFLFSGQGAQWYAMGRELLKSSPAFFTSIAKATTTLHRLGAKWNLLDELMLEEKDSRVNESEIGQPASTAIQVALVDHLEALGVRPNAVLGHSSGEIAAAYTAGILTHDDAMAVSFHRSFLSKRSKELLEKQGYKQKGSMAAVGLSEADATIATSMLTRGVVKVACNNSPSSTTVSGDEAAIDELLSELGSSVFARKLKIDTAYHSHHMEVVADEYLNALSGIEEKSAKSAKPSVVFLSSVTAEQKTTHFGPQYWVDNLVSTVRFYDALDKYCREEHANSQATMTSPTHIFVEIGPHSALAGPFRQTIQGLDLNSFKSLHLPTLVRGRNAQLTMLETTRKLFEIGAPFELSSICQYASSHERPLVINNLPPYAFDNRISYWHESRLSKEYRFRAHPHHDLLGLRLIGADPQEPVWRNIVSVEALPWLKEHVIDSFITFPGTGYLTMAIEAISQHGQDLNWAAAHRYILRNISFTKALLVTESEKIEVQLSLKQSRGVVDKITSGWHEFRISSYTEEQGWSDHCNGTIQIEFSPAQYEGDAIREELFSLASSRQRLDTIKDKCRQEIPRSTLYSDLEKNGNEYGENFAVFKDFHIGDREAMGTIVTPNVSSVMAKGFMQPHVIHPATFDAMLHMSVPLFVKHGGLGSVMPVHIEEFSVAGIVGNKPGDELLCISELTPQGPRTANTDAIAYQRDTDGNAVPVVTILGGELRSVGQAKDVNTVEARDRQFTYHMEWKRDMNFLSVDIPDILDAKLPPIASVLSPEEKENLFTEMTAYYINESLREIGAANLKIPDTYLKHYHNWLKVYQASEPCTQIYKTLDQAKFEANLRVADQVGVQGEILKRVGQNLTKIVTGQVEAMEVFMEGGLHSHLYDNEQGLQCAMYLSQYITQLSHKHPYLNVLEIGGGTGGTTRPLFEDLHKRGSLPFRRYTFTDLSASFFEKAQEYFSDESCMEFKKFDVEQDPIHQGLAAGSYDLIIGANVVHATRSLSTTLANVKTLLKPGGSLALIEVVRPTPAYNLTFGAIEGWWNGVADGRVLTPLLAPDKWHQVLSENGFNGVEMELHDLETPAYISSLLISRSALTVKPVLPTVIFVDGAFLNRPYVVLSMKVETELKLRGVETCFTSWPITNFNKDAVYVVLDSGEKPMLVDPSEELFSSIKQLAIEGRNIMWISAQDSVVASNNPEKGLVAGFSRVARSENPDLNFVIFDVQQTISAGQHMLPKALSEVLFNSFCTNDKYESEDYEYGFKNNEVIIPRLVPNEKLNALTTNILGEAKAETGHFHQPSRPLKLHVENPGLLDSLIFVDDERAHQQLQPDEIEIEVKACGINFKDVFIALGQMKATTKMVGECAGIITAVGSNCTGDFKIGDRVCAWNGSPYASRARLSGYSAYRIPDSMSFEIAASIPVVFATAYYGIVEVARLQKGESILIHAAAGGVGQAAIVIAQHIGAEVFATVGGANKRVMLTEKYSIPESHIFSSRERSFKQGILRMTNGKGLNVVLNSLSGEALHDTFDCIAPFGTFVEIGKSDIYKDSKLSMAPFDKNISFASVDLVVMAEHRPTMMKSLLASVMSKFEDGSYKPVYPVTAMPISEIENAFRLIQGRKHTGKVVLTAADDVVVKVSAPTTAELSIGANGTYVIAGGMGNLGMEIAKFMAKHGAGHIVLLSRRTVPVVEQQLLQKEFDPYGTTVRAIACDITDMKAIRNVVEECKKTMPAVRGVIQATMVVHDFILDLMTASDFQVAVKPKLAGTQNLISGFSTDHLDFFLCLSSIVALVGARAQANYAAGNAFMDSLAMTSERLNPNTHFATVNVGMVQDSAAASLPQRIRSMLRQGCIPVYFEELLRLVGYLMSPQAKSDGHRQVAVGFNRTSFQQEGLYTLKSNLFNHLPYAEEEGVQLKPAQGTVAGVEETLAAAKDSQEVHGIISNAIAKRMSALVAVDEISHDTPMVEIGFDSLIAIELKNWIARTFQSQLQAHEILSTPNIRTLSSKVASRSALVKINVQNGREIMAQ